MSDYILSLSLSKIFHAAVHFYLTEKFVFPSFSLFPMIYSREILIRVLKEKMKNLYFWTCCMCMNQIDNNYISWCWQNKIVRFPLHTLDISCQIPPPRPVPQLETYNLIKLTISQKRQKRQLLSLIHSMKPHSKMSLISSKQLSTLL